MRVLDVCSGISAPSIAWKPLGWEFAAYAEIEKFPSAVLAHHHPATPNLGDMTQFKEWDIDEPIDLLVGGTPCQSFSVAGLRRGLDDPRGSLMFTFLAIARRFQPRWVVWENVPGVLSSNGGRDFGTFLGGLGQLGYGFAHRVLDAQFVRVDSHPHAVPQRRRRVFVVGYLGDWRRAAAVLFESEGLRGDSPPRRKAGEAVAAPTTNGVGTCGADDNQAQSVPLTAFGGGNTGGPIDVATACNGHSGRFDFESETLISFAQDGVRRLTPRECERLQGFPDDFTLIPWRGKPASDCPDGPRYRALGNSMAVNVMRWIGERIALVERIARAA